MCTKCGKSIGAINQESYIQPVENTVDTNCEKSIEYWITIKNKLECFLLTDLYVNCNKQEVINILGWVQSMINLNQPCKFDLNYFLERIQYVECSITT